MMNLTKTQLLHIKAFIEQRGFIYLDVQMEILDHVASAVEEKMNADNTLSFEEAIKQTHLGFGVMGFSVIETGIVRALSKKYKRMFWNCFKSLFSFKYILIIFAAIFALYKLQTIVTDSIQFTSILIFGLVILAFVTTIFSFKGWKFKKLISYRISSTYMPLAGLFLVYLNMFVNNAKIGLVMGLDINYIVVAIVITLFMAYSYAGIITGFKGLAESKSLMEKYNLLYS